MSLREKAGITQFQVAVAMGRTPGAISKWDRSGAAEFSPSEVYKAREVYNCTYEELSAAFANASVKMSLGDFLAVLDLGNMGLTEVINWLHVRANGEAPE
jgi:transcriptional regulator with XRE-family HTH domain